MSIKPPKSTMKSTKKEADYLILQKDLDKGQLKPVYLLHGEERFLVAHYADALGEGCDRDNFDATAAVGQIILAADALPFFAEKRAVYVRESKLFAAKRKADSEDRVRESKSSTAGRKTNSGAVAGRKTDTDAPAGHKTDTDALADYIPRIPPETVLIFVESDVDKRTRLYKRVAEVGRVVDCTPLAPDDLSRWVIKKFRERGKSITPAAAATLMRATAHSMNALVGEIAKLAAYVGERPSVTAEDIAALCTPTLQTRIFDLLAAMGKGDTAQALTLYTNMLHMKESPHMILAMVIRQFRLLLQCKCAQEKKYAKTEMAKAFGLRDFMVDEALRQVRRYSTETLLAALADCSDTDVRMKTGRMGAEMGVELLVIKYSV